MKKFLKYVTLLMVTVMCASCEDVGYPMKGNTLVVTNEYAIDENISLYTLKYEDTRASGLAHPDAQALAKPLMETFTKLGYYGMGNESV